MIKQAISIPVKKRHLFRILKIVKHRSLPEGIIFPHTVLPLGNNTIIMIQQEDEAS